MGTTQTTLEATAITPSLFYGDQLTIPHIQVNDSTTVVECIQAGQNVLVSNEETALIALLTLGLSLDEARSAIDLAKFGLPRSH